MSHMEQRKNKSMKIAMGVILFILLFAACGKAEGEKGNTPIPPSKTTLQRSLTPSITHSISFFDPTLIATLEYPTNNMTWTPSPTWNPTEVAYVTLVASFPNRCVDSYHGRLLSPDENWLAENCIFGELRVLKQDGTQNFVISYDELFGSVTSGCESAQPVHWTEDNQYLYFIRQSGCSSSPIWNRLDRNYFGTLFKLDTNTGFWSAFDGNNNNYGHYSFSPTGRRLIQNFNLDLTIYDLKTGDKQSVAFSDYLDVGAFLWSPDGLAFTFAAQKSIDPITDPDHFKYSVFIYDIQSKTLQKILTDSLDRRIPQDWTADGILVIPVVDSSNDPIPGQTLYYIINARSFITQTPTP
jgi:hypothetical protein